VIFDAAGRPLRAVRAATASGSTVQFKRRLKPRAPVDMAHAGQTEKFDLLTTPLHVLKAQADELRSAETAREIGREGTSGGERKGGLWVDKYRPTKFSDLLGEDVSSSRAWC
jgi:chromosome transmission fidelity protein 18